MATTVKCPKCSNQFQLDNKPGGTKCADCRQPIEFDTEAAVHTDQGWIHLQCHTVTPELSLLIIDLGESCVVKVEKGTMPTLPLIRVTTGNHHIQVVDQTFAELRAAIDALADDEKPVPRIEQEGEEYRVWIYEAYERVITGDTFNALSALAGKPLPIYEPRKGKWVRLNTHDWTQTRKDAGEAGYGIDTFSYENALCPVKIWRYSR